MVSSRRSSKSLDEDITPAKSARTRRRSSAASNTDLDDSHVSIPLTPATPAVGSTPGSVKEKRRMGRPRKGKSFSSSPEESSPAQTPPSASSVPPADVTSGPSTTSIQENSSSLFFQTNALHQFPSRHVEGLLDKLIDSELQASQHSDEVLTLILTSDFNLS